MRTSSLLSTGLTNHSLPASESYPVSPARLHNTRSKAPESRQMLLRCQSVNSLGKAPRYQNASHLNHEAFIFKIEWRQTREACLFLSSPSFFFLPEPQILRPLNRKKQCSEWPCLNYHSSTGPNGTIVQQENSYQWMRLLWPTHYEEDDRCIVRGLSDFLVCSNMC